MLCVFMRFDVIFAKIKHIIYDYGLFRNEMLSELRFDDLDG